VGLVSGTLGHVVTSGQERVLGGAHSMQHLLAG
jgi:hypothetical protein